MTALDMQDVHYHAKYPRACVQVPKDIPLLQLPDGETQAFRHLAQNIVMRTLAHESEYRRQKRHEPSQAEWKLFKCQDELHMYKRRSRQGRGAKRPMVLCIGSKAGPLKDVLYGLQAKTREEMQVLLPFKSKRHIECALLANLEGASALDPYRQVALKWHQMDALCDVNVMKVRDLCTLESMGLSRDVHGEPYAYFLVQSVDFPACPRPRENSSVVRANMMFCCIYRNVPDSHLVSVYAKGMFDLGGETPSFLIYTTSCSLMSSILNAMEYAEAKRLTLLALQKAQDAAALSHEDHDMERLTPSEISHSTSGFSVDVAMSPCLPRLVATRKSRLKRQPRDEPCCVCAKKPAMAALIGVAHRTCGVCLRGVCNKCHVKRQLIAQPQPRCVVCCKSCLLEAKHVPINPLDPCPILA